MSYDQYEKIISAVKLALNANGHYNEEEGVITLDGNDIDHVATDVAEFVCGDIEIEEEN